MGKNYGVTKSCVRLFEKCEALENLSPGEGNSNPLQCSCLEDPKNGGTGRAAVDGVAQSWTHLSDLAAAENLKHPSFNRKKKFSEK